MQKYLIEEVAVGDSKEGTTNGREWKLTNIKLKIDGDYHQSAVFNERDVEMLKDSRGKEVLLSLYVEEYDGKNYSKFKVATPFQILEVRVKAIEDFLRDKFVASTTKTPVTKPTPAPNTNIDDDLPF